MIVIITIVLLFLYYHYYYGARPQDKLYGNATAEVMDNEVRGIVEEAYKRFY